MPYGTYSLFRIEAFKTLFLYRMFTYMNRCRNGLNFSQVLHNQFAFHIQLTWRWIIQFNASLLPLPQPPPATVSIVSQMQPVHVKFNNEICKTWHLWGDFSLSYFLSWLLPQGAPSPALRVFWEVIPVLWVSLYAVDKRKHSVVEFVAHDTNRELFEITRYSWLRVSRAFS